MSFIFGKGFVIHISSLFQIKLMSWISEGKASLRKKCCDAWCIFGGGGTLSILKGEG